MAIKDSVGNQFPQPNAMNIKTVSLEVRPDESLKAGHVPPGPPRLGFVLAEGMKSTNVE